MNIITKYDELLKEAKAKAEAFALTAREYIPKMYDALRNEDSNLTPEDARDRIQKDCIGIWSKRTILDALPNEAKDLKKQKAGRLSKKEHVSAAFSAAPELPEPLDSGNSGTLDFEFSLCKGDVWTNLIDSLADEEEGKEDDGNNDKPNQNLIWFTGTIDRDSGKVISAVIGRTKIAQIGASLLASPPSS
jgi:hypothetical protein